MDSADPHSEELREVLKKLRERTVEPASGRSEVRPLACLSSLDIGELAAGVMEQERASLLLEHINSCVKCATKLRDAREDFARPMTAGEEGLLAELESSRPAWQAALAASSVRRPSRFWQRGRWVLYAAVLVLGLGAVWLLRQSPTDTLASLIDRAYLDGRPFEFRLSLPGYAVLAQQKGNSSATGQSASLHEAEAKIARLGPGDRTSAEMLKMRGLADLLNRNADEAVESLKRASELSRGDAGLKADLGSALALRGEMEQRPSDYAAAIESLSEALRQQPNELSAIFNMALVYERLHQYDEAAQYWNRYLKLDGSSGWANEAREHLQDLELKKKPAPKP